jgi:hypothetical protein
MDSHKRRERRALARAHGQPCQQVFAHCQPREQSRDCGTVEFKELSL